MAQPIRKGLSISALARAFQRDRRTIAAAVEGLEPIGQAGVARLYFLPDVEKRLGGRAGSTNLRRAIHRKLAAEADRVEQKVAEKRATLVPIQDTVGVVASAYRLAAEHFGRVPAAIAGEFVRANSEAEARTILTRAVHQTLVDLAEAAMAEASRGDS